MLIIENLIDNNYEKFSGRQKGSLNWDAIMNFIGGVSFIYFLFLTFLEQKWICPKSNEEVPHFLAFY